MEEEISKGRRERKKEKKFSKRRPYFLKKSEVSRLKKGGKAYTARRKAASMLRKHNKEVRKTERIRFYNKKYATFCRRLNAYVKKKVPEGSYFLHSPGPIGNFENIPVSDEAASREEKPPALHATWHSKKDKSFLEWELNAFFFSSKLKFLGMLILKDTAEFTHDVNYVRKGGKEAKPILVVTPKNLVVFSDKYVSIRKEGWSDENYYSLKWLMETFSGVSFEDYPQTFEEKAKYWSPKTKWYSTIDAVTIMVWSEDVVESLRDLGPIPKRCLLNI